MILEAILAIIIVCIIALIVNYTGICDRKPKYIMSIKESIDLCNLPVVTFTNNNSKFNFIVDSGAEDNHLCNEAFKKLGDYIEAKCCTSIQGFNSESSVNKVVKTSILYKDKEYETSFFISKDLDNSFKAIKDETGVNLDGILGTKFFVKYGYVFDFDRLVIYSKK